MPYKRCRSCAQVVTLFSRFIIRCLPLIVLSIHPAVAQDANSDRGRALYENQCSECHDKHVHQRDNRRANSIDELRVWVLAWTIHSGIDWSMEEVDDVTAYLGRYLYDFNN